jgi:FAD:protein FMN transferase
MTQLVKNLFSRIISASFFLILMLNGAAQHQRFSFTEQKMGAPFTIVFYAPDSASANQLARQCFRLVDSFVLIFSNYIDSSELSRLSAGAGNELRPIPVSPALLDILLLSKTAYEKSGGAFDITIGPLSALWRTARKTNQFPSDESVQAAKRLVGFHNLRIDTLHKTVLFLQSGIKLDLGGIAQGYIAQKIMDFLKGQQVTNALINVSGDIVTSGPPPGLPGWTVGVNMPQHNKELLAKKLLLHHKSVTTSGDVYQYMEHGGKKYSHIIDPRMGYGITFQRNITVVANDGVTADWLATACSILPLNKAKKLARQIGAALLVSEIKRGKVVTKATKDFDDYWK